MHTILLLTISNIFMTFAWYDHLKYKDVPLWQAIVVSWLIAFVKHCFQMPAYRIVIANLFSRRLQYNPPMLISLDATARAHTVFTGTSCPILQTRGTITSLFR